MSYVTIDEKTGQKVYFGKWSPPPRPEWVARINEEGEYIDARAVVPLDAASLIDWAQRNTGLNDFGSDDWREPFQVFLKSVDEEAHLNLMGRLWVRAEVLNLLEARLQVEHEFKQHPEIADEVIEKPIVIIGQGRSGTTALFNLLAVDPRVGIFRQWESMYPCPPPEAATYRTDPRIEKADDITLMQQRITPEFAGMHIIGGDAPRECGRILALTFRTTWLNTIAQCPSYQRYIAGQDTTAAYVYEKRLMQLLQWKNPRQRWLIKNPLHLDRLPELFSVFPDACIVWMHRDPLRSQASGISMSGTWQWQRTDQPFAQAAAWEFLTDPSIVARRFERVIDWLEQGVVPKEKMLSLHYKDFVADRLTTAQKIYEYFGFGMPQNVRQILQAYIDENPRDKRPPHQYSIGSDEDALKGRQAFKRYQEYFSVVSE